MKTQTTYCLLSLAIFASYLLHSPAQASDRSLQGVTTTTIVSEKAQMAKSGTIVDITASNSSFKTLVAAIQAAGLAEVLSGKGPFTVFAPTDDAFIALPPGTLEELLKPENKEKLQKILTYHVVSGDIKSKTLKSGEVKTVEGSSVNIQIKDEKAMVNDANVIKTDIKASNGVIHVIDRVILPPGI
ncbi:MAG: fasciclin domain-containing protein [Aphanocapsa sp. GSE-SYN-MK-11-07L]|jgi:uncharacterized surface protein with fasciclin (FAS1) repeats|nr:fasciclin domain-containing protein [Aphanocapsa sp. GSE-SYN-MK-11-07L]